MVLPLFVANRIFLDFADYPGGPNGGELLRLLHAIAGVPVSEESARFAASPCSKRTACCGVVSAALGCRAAEGLTRLGHNDEALTMMEQLEARFRKAIRPMQLHALALAPPTSRRVTPSIWTKHRRRGGRTQSGNIRDLWTDLDAPLSDRSRLDLAPGSHEICTRRRSKPHGMPTIPGSTRRRKACCSALRPTWRRPTNMPRASWTSSGLGFSRAITGRLPGQQRRCCCRRIMKRLISTRKRPRTAQAGRSRVG